MDLSEFCAAAISVHQLEGTDRWEQHARAAYEIFEKEGNRVITFDELARVRPVYLSLGFDIDLPLAWVSSEVKYWLVHSLLATWYHVVY